MRISSCLALTLFLITGSFAHAGQRAFQIHTLKQITPQVERFYALDGGAFATMFCRSDAAEVMFVDSRVPDLDGRSFFFKSPADCIANRDHARQNYRKCVTELKLNTDTMTAVIESRKCR